MDKSIISGDCSPLFIVVLLGGVTESLVSGDLNNLSKIATYTIGLGSYWDNISNKPTDITGQLGAGILLVLPGSDGSDGGWRVQIIIDQSAHFVFRSIYRSNPSYNTSWKSL